MSETASLDRPGPAVVDAVQAGSPVVERPSGAAAHEGGRAVREPMGGER